MKKIPRSERIRKEIKGPLQGDEEDNLLGRIFRKGMRLILEELYESEAPDFWERGHYERRGERDFRGYRNGYEPRKIKTAERMLEVELPQVRDTVKLFVHGHPELLEQVNPGGPPPFTNTCRE